MSFGQKVGIEGTTGDSSGIHLHVEMQDISKHDWIFGADKSVYTNPAEFMGFPNKQGITIYYDGTPVDPPDPSHPTNPIIRRTSNNWKKYLLGLSGNYILRR